ncbi:MAG: short chain dehydrogenase [Chitinophagaceae bacterium]|nr:short chain dehydrogenase [Chitinophagaceae bacterium]
MGKRVASSLEKEHEVIKVSNRNGVFKVDTSFKSSIEALFKEIGPFDALVAAMGRAHLGDITGLTDKEFKIGIESKLLAQINLVLIGQHYINDGGCFTLTSGILSEDPIPQGTACTTTDAAVNAFVRAAAIDLKRGIRINAVAPGVVEDAPALFPYFPGHIPVSMQKVAAAYHKSLFGGHTGEVFRAY